MKNLIFIALSYLPFIAFSQELEIVKITAINTVSTFGRLGSDCSGRGICSFSETTNKAITNSTVVYNEDNTITLVIDRSRITKEDTFKIIGETLTEQTKVSELTFVMEESLELDSGLKLRLQTPLPLNRILKGSYPVKTTKESYIITLKMN